MRVGRAVHLAAAALDARERVEHLLPLDVLQRLEPDLLLLEVEVRHRGEHAATAGRRSAATARRWKCFESGMSTRNAEDDQRVDPPVHARRQRRSPSRKASRNVTISVRMKQPDQHRLDRHVVAQRRRPHDDAPDQQADDADEHGERERHERQRVERGTSREPRQVDDAEPGEELDAAV